MSKQLIKLARILSKDIGCHHKLIGGYYPTEVYQAAQQRSDEAVATAKYLIQQLDNRHHAVVFADAVGMSGYINQR